MNDFIATDAAIGALALAIAILYAARHETRAKIRAMPICCLPWAQAA
jgi:hypothetical protein